MTQTTAQPPGRPLPSPARLLAVVRQASPALVDPCLLLRAVAARLTAAFGEDPGSCWATGGRHELDPRTVRWTSGDHEIHSNCRRWATAVAVEMPRGHDLVWASPPDNTARKVP